SRADCRHDFDALRRTGQGDPARPDDSYDGGLEEALLAWIRSRRRDRQSQGGPAGESLSGFRPEAGHTRRSDPCRSRSHVHAGKYVLQGGSRKAGARFEARAPRRLRLRQARDAGRRTDSSWSESAGASTGRETLMSEATVVEADSLAKSYGSVKALDEVTFQVRTGEIFGFIGADGAGKTTAFKIIAGVLAEGGGEIRVLGTTPRKAGSQVGYLTQPFSLYFDLSIDENLSYAGGLRLVPKKEYEERRELYFKMFDIYRFSDRLAGSLKGGMEAKVAAFAPLSAGTKLLFLHVP